MDLANAERGVKTDRRMLASEWAILIREDVRRVAAHPCVYVTAAGQENAQCGKCTTCYARKDLIGLETAK